MEYKWTVLTVTAVGLFMATLDSSIVVVGLPTIIEDLNTSLIAGIWVITGYRLMITIFLVTLGRIADMIGRVKLYNSGFAVFTAGSLLCALSPNAEILIISRLVQGFGGALIFVNGTAIVVDAFSGADLGTAFGINQLSINAGTVIGYTLSGVMIGLFGWRSIFWVNIPIGVFGTVWAHIRLKELYTKSAKEQFDHLGAILFSCALTVLLLGFTIGDIHSWDTQGLILVSLALFAVFVAHEKRVQHPILDLSLFRIRAFTTGNPLIEYTKTETLKLAIKLGVPLELTWSCHENGQTPCGKCRGCRMRLKAFEEAGARDPLLQVKTKLNEA